MLIQFRIQSAAKTRRAADQRDKLAPTPLHFIRQGRPLLVQYVKPSMLSGNEKGQAIGPGSWGDTGQTRKYSTRANDFRCSPNNGHRQDTSTFPLRADTVAKVENRTTPKISQKLIFGLLCDSIAFQSRQEGPWSILEEAIRSLTSPRVKRISGSKNFRSTPQKDFCNNICQQRKSGCLFDHALRTCEQGIRNNNA
jgi:hypothetical protein